jgi:hypothetical protein
MPAMRPMRLGGGCYWQQAIAAALLAPWHGTMQCVCDHFVSSVGGQASQAHPYLQVQAQF